MRASVKVAARGDIGRDPLHCRTKSATNAQVCPADAREVNKQCATSSFCFIASPPIRRCRCQRHGDRRPRPQGLRLLDRRRRFHRLRLATCRLSHPGRQAPHLLQCARRFRPLGVLADAPADPRAGRAGCPRRHHGAGRLGRGPSGVQEASQTLNEEPALALRRGLPACRREGRFIPRRSARRGCRRR